jgi:hypothetical protein
MARRDHGSVRKLPSGRWQARYRNRGGGWCPPPATFTTKGDATAWLALAQTDQARGHFIDPRAGRITLAAFADCFLAERVLAERTAETYRGYSTAISVRLLGTSRWASWPRGWSAPGMLE